MWFLWLLFVITLAPVALHSLAPGAIAFLGRLSASAATRPGRYFAGLTVALALAYVPLALAFTPWNWVDHGPFSFQLSRPLIYSVYYLTGFGVGVHGRNRGLLDPDGALGRRWKIWGLRALISLSLWMGLTGWSLNQSPPVPLALEIAADLSYALAGATSFYFIMALCLRFGAVRVRWLEGLSNNAMGVYVIHYAPVVWLQYLLMDVQLIAVAKAAIVLGGALACSLAATRALRSFPARRAVDRPSWSGSRRSLETAADAPRTGVVKRSQRHRGCGDRVSIGFARQRLPQSGSGDPGL